MSKGQGKNVLLMFFWSTLGILFLYWALTYKPSGDFFELDKPANNIHHDATKYDNKRFKALTESFKG